MERKICKRRGRKEYFDGQYNMDKEKWVVVNISDFDDARRSSYFGGKPVSRN